MDIKRSSGVLLPVFSLPSKYGIGTLGRAAYDFVYFLSQAGQSWWQMLPVGPCGAGNSPYYSLSSFKGNPLFIDLDMLISDGILSKEDVESIDWGSDPLRVDYEKVNKGRAKLFSRFSEEEIQGFFDKQWNELKDYAHSKGVGLIGDLPIYVPLESEDVAENKQFFDLDTDGKPKDIAGVPPDYFSKDGQLWNDPLYNWEALKADGYGYWIRRVGKAAQLYDVIRLDHFRAFASYWSIPYGETSAKKGHWEKGPGLDFVNMLTSWFCNTGFIAEDLGIIGDDVRSLIRDSGLAGMKILEFAFSDGPENAYLPHNIEENSVCYIGTHDNANLKEWYDGATVFEKAMATKYLGLNEKEGLEWGFIRAGMSSKAKLFIARMQDYLGLGKEARINTPGTVGDMNWSWRMSADALSPELCSRMLDCTKLFGR